MAKPSRITRVVLKNYKSVASCDVELGPLTILVGPNGSGKSNFLDALRFVADALTNGLDQAIRARGYADQILSKATAHGDDEFSIELRFSLESGSRGEYGLTIGARSLGGYEMRREWCKILGPVGSALDAYFSVERDGELASWSGVSISAEVAPARVHDRLYLVNLSGLPEFRPVYNMLSRMTFYNLNTAVMREPQKPERGETLDPDGGNLTSVFRRLHETATGTQLRIVEYLGHIVPGISKVDTIRPTSSYETLRFRQRLGQGDRDWWQFAADDMSDGTLRSLGVLVALFQAHMAAEPHVSLVGIEEPENALHPAAAGVLLDALREASETVQVLVTSHSPALLDTDEIDPGLIRAVVSEDGKTFIGPVDAASRTVLERHLYTAGELLRMNQLRPLKNGAASDRAPAHTGPGQARS